MDSAGEDLLGAEVLIWLVPDDLVDDDLEERRQFVALALLLLEFIEEACEGFRPALVHLNHLRLNIQQHVVNVVQVLLSERLQNEQPTRVVQRHAFVPLGRKLTDRAQQLHLVQRLLVLLRRVRLLWRALVLKGSERALDDKEFNQIKLSEPLSRSGRFPSYVLRSLP